VNAKKWGAPLRYNRRMTSRAAAKGRSLSLLAAVCLLATLLLSPTAEASRGLPAALAPALTAPATPDQVLEAELSDPPERLRLFDDLRLPPRPLELVEARKTASGVKHHDLGLNIQQTGGLDRNCSGLSFQGLWTDPVTGISYARNRWYDARTASWLSEDPLGAVDSPNLYAFVGWRPHAATDPMGLFEGAMVAAEIQNEQIMAEAGPAPLSQTDERMFALFASLPGAVFDRVVGIAFFPMLAAGSIHDRAHSDAEKVAAAFDEGGRHAANAEIERLREEEHKDFLLGVAKSIPPVGTGFAVDNAFDVCDQDAGAPCGEAWAEVIVSAEIDAAVVYGASKGVRGASAASEPELVAARRSIAEKFYRESGFSEAATAEHIRGIDFTQPVDVVTIPSGAKVIQYQIPGGPQGNYYAPVGTPGNRLGFYTSGVEAVTYTAGENVRALRSTAATTIDDWSMRAYGWEIETTGGGTQYFTTSPLDLAP